MVSTEHARIENEWRLSGKIPKVQKVTAPSVPTRQSKPREAKKLNQSTPSTDHGAKIKVPLDNQRRNKDVQGSKGVTRASALSKDKPTGGHSPRPSSTDKGAGVATGGRRNILPKKS